VEVGKNYRLGVGLSTRFSLIVLAVLLTSQSLLIPAVESIPKAPGFEAADVVASGSRRTLYFHNYLNMTDLLYARTGWPKNGSVFAFSGADFQPPPGGQKTEQRLKCMIEGPERCVFGICRTIWGGVISWPLTEKLEHTVKMKGFVDFYVWMKSISMDSGRFDGAGVAASLVEIDPSTQKIVWRSEIGKVGGNNWDMSESPTEYHVQLDVNHIFRNGSQIAFFVGIANTDQGREAFVYFDDVERPSRVEVPWDEEWRPPPPEYRIALVDYMSSAWSSADDLTYLGFTFDTYTEKNITSLLVSARLNSYSALFIASYACDPDLVEPYYNQIYANFSANKELVRNYVNGGGGLLIMGHETYEWLPDDLSKYTGVVSYKGYNIDMYYAAHVLTTYPNDLAHERALPGETWLRDWDRYLYYRRFAAWNTYSEPPGTQHGIYQSIGQDKLKSVCATNWIAGTYGKGKVTITTTLLDIHSGSEYSWGIPFYDGREAIENMLWWVCELPYP